MHQSSLLATETPHVIEQTTLDTSSMLNDKHRLFAYSQIEQKCLALMDELIEHYAAIPSGEDLKIDRFKAELARDFLKNTQHVRDELVEKLGILTGNDKKRTIEVKFV